MKYSAIDMPVYGARYCIAAASDAFAATIIVCPNPSNCSKVATVVATLPTFCPIATYMHTTSPPFWLIIVSIHIAVLPVVRSPIINSL